MLELISESAPVFIAVVFMFALLIGSFLNVIIHRLPIMMEREWRDQVAELQKTPSEKELIEGRFDLTMPRSRCPSCGKLITALQNIPVISYLFLKGRCANCKTSISARYPLVELFTASLAAITAWHFGADIEALMAIALAVTLIAIAMIDADTQLIPDSIVLPLMWVGLSMSLFHPLSGALARMAATTDRHYDVCCCRYSNQRHPDRIPRQRSKRSNSLRSLYSGSWLDHDALG